MIQGSLKAPPMNQLVPSFLTWFRSSRCSKKEIRRRKKKVRNRLEDTCLKSPGRSRWPSNAAENYKVRGIVECNPAIIRWSNYHKKGSNFTQCSLFFPLPSLPVRGHGCSLWMPDELHVVDNGAQGSSADRLSRFLNKFSMASRGPVPSSPMRESRVP